MSDKKKDELVSRMRVLTRQEKIDAWEDIYADCIDIIKRNLGNPKTSQAVYAAVTALNTATKEIGWIENIMIAKGELPPKLPKDINSWYGGLDLEMPQYDPSLNN